MLIILCFDLFRCPAAQGLVEAFRVPPRDPPERRQLQVVHVLEGFALPDELGFVRAIDGLGHGVVVGVADRAGRGHHPVFQHPDGAHEGGADPPRRTRAARRRASARATTDPRDNGASPRLCFGKLVFRFGGGDVLLDSGVLVL